MAPDPAGPHLRPLGALRRGGSAAAARGHHPRLAGHPTRRPSAQLGGQGQRVPRLPHPAGAVPRRRAGVPKPGPSEVLLPHPGLLLGGEQGRELAEAGPGGCGQFEEVICVQNKIKTESIELHKI